MLTRPVFATCLGTQRQAAFKLALQNASSTTAARKTFATSTVATAIRTSSARNSSKPSSLLLLLAGGSSLAFYTSNARPIRCEPTTSAARPYAEPHTPSIQGPGSSKLSGTRQEPAVESSVDLKNLSFGALAGISTGIFIKKGLKAVGFLLGGAFVFLQYMVSRGLVKVDWASMASRYENTVDRYAGQGSGSRVSRLGSRVLDFLLADFPPRATFAAGLALGLRLG